MTGMQSFDSVLVALAALAGIAIALSVVIFMAASAAKPGAAPQGGIRRDLPQHPQPDTDDARVLVLR
jgi:hypothetical protein